MLRIGPRLFTWKAVFLISLLLFVAGVSESINVYDFFIYAKMLQSHDFGYLISNAFSVWSGSASGWSRSSLYVAASYPFVLLGQAAGFGAELSLGLFSSLCVAVSAIFVFKTLRIYFNSGNSFVGSVFFILMPWIFFNGINATLTSLQLMLTSAWAYFLLSGIEQKKPGSAYFSSAFLAMNVFTHLTAAPLVLAHFFGLARIAEKTPGKKKFLAYNALLLLPAFALLYYFTFVTTAYRMQFDMYKIVFSVILLAWESLNAMSLPIFAAFLFSMAVVARNIRKIGNFDSVFLLAFVASLSSLLVFQYVPVANFTTLFVFLPVLVMRFFSTHKRIFVAIAIILLLIKIYPLFLNFSLYPHPHKEYALWLGETVPASAIVFAGHECQAVKYYTGLEVVCRGDTYVNSTEGKRIFVTSQYFKNENQIELEYAGKLFNISLINKVQESITRSDPLYGMGAEKYATFPHETRKMEDQYEFLYSVYPNPVTNVFISTDFPKESYILYEVG